MKIAVTSTGPSLDAQVEPRFGRCPWFLVGETETMQFEAVENTNANLGGGVGIQAGQTMAKMGVTHVLTGNCGPNAHQTLSAAGISIVVGCSGRVRDMIERFKSDRLTASAGANVQDHFGMGGNGGNDMARGGGRGQGMGGGRGMGSGRGMGLAPGSDVSDAGKYVSSTPEPARRKRGTAAVDKDMCTGCGVCVDMCPMGAISMGGETAYIDPEMYERLKHMTLVMPERLSSLCFHIDERMAGADNSASF